MKNTKIKGKDYSFRGEFDKIDFNKYLKLENGFWNLVFKMINEVEGGGGACLSFYYDKEKKFYGFYIDGKINSIFNNKNAIIYSRIEYGLKKSINQIKEILKQDFTKLGV